ncbi:MAG: type II CAAX endopeptidase family protein [Candidatus Micrarchaeota archaeon]
MLLMFQSFLAVNAKAVLLSFAILIAPFALVWLEGKKARKELLLSKLKFLQTLVHGLGLFATAFLLLLVEGIVLSAAGLLDNQSVIKIISVQDPLILLAAVTIGPVGEELLFRGYLQKKIGVPLQALLFGLFHYGYGSLAEILAAITIGLLFGLYVKKYRNIYSAVFAHALYNLFSIIIVFSIFV